MLNYLTYTDGFYNKINFLAYVTDKNGKFCVICICYYNEKICGMIIFLKRFKLYKAIKASHLTAIFSRVKVVI